MPSVSLEAIALESTHAPLRPRMLNEIHESIAHVCHGSLVKWQVEEIEEATKTQILKLGDEFGLRVAIGNVADHERSGWHVLVRMSVLLLQVQVLGHVSVTVLLGHRTCL